VALDYLCVFFPASLDYIDVCHFFPARASTVWQWSPPIYAVERGNPHFSVVDGALMTSSGTHVIRYFNRTPVPPLDWRVEELGARCFSDLPMTSFTFSTQARLRIIGSNAFMSCTKLRSITIPSTVELIGWRAFGHCVALARVWIETVSQLRLIEREAFDYCETLEPIDVPSSATIRGAFKVLGMITDEEGSNRLRVRFTRRKSG
jgi:hypothetical protein